MYAGGLSSISSVGCVLVFLIPTIHCIDICRSGTTGGMSLTITRSRDYTKNSCICYIHNPGEIKMEINLHFEPTKTHCTERFVIRKNDSPVFVRCSNDEIVINVTNKEVITRIKDRGFSIIYSWNGTRETGRTGYLNLTLKSPEQKTNITVHCNPIWTTAAPTQWTTPDVTTEFKLITTSSSATPKVSNPAASSTSNKPDVTTAGSKSGGRSRDPTSKPISFAITTPKDGQGSEGPTTVGTDIQAGSSRETERNGVGIQTFLIVIVVLAVVIFAFIIGAVVFFCRRKTHRRETEETKTPVIYAEPNKSNRLPRPRCTPEDSEPAYLASSDVTNHIPVPQKSWEVEGQIPRHSVMVENVVYDTEND